MAIVLPRHREHQFTVFQSACHVRIPLMKYAAAARAVGRGHYGALPSNHRRHMFIRRNSEAPPLVAYCEAVILADENGRLLFTVMRRIRAAPALNGSRSQWRQPV